MSNKPATMRIGDLLIKAGILDGKNLQESMQIAGETGLPIGRVLIMSGYLAEHELKSALQAQSMLKDGVLTEEIALKALTFVSQEGDSWEHALKKAGWLRKEEPVTNKIGELLLQAHVITREQLNEALSTSFETGLPVGRILVLTGILSEGLLAAVLNAQVMVRDGKITREQAVQGIKSAQQRRVSLEQSLIDNGFYRLPARQHVKLGELLVLAGMLSESDLMNVLEIGLVNEKPLGEVMVQSGFVSKTVLDAALRLQDMVANQTLAPLQAAEALSAVYTKGVSVACAVAEIGQWKPQPHETVKLGELLKVAGLVTQNDIQRALDLATKNSSLIGKMLLVTGMIDESTLHAALRCQFLIREGFLKMEEAIIALHSCQRNQISFDDALEELGWTVPTRLREERLLESQPAK